LHTRVIRIKGVQRSNDVPRKIRERESEGKSLILNKMSARWYRPYCEKRLSGEPTPRTELFDRNRLEKLQTSWSDRGVKKNIERNTYGMSRIHLIKIWRKKMDKGHGVGVENRLH